MPLTNLLFAKSASRFSGIIAFALLCLRPLIKASSLCSAESIVVGYLPRRSRGWILEFLFKDLAKYGHDSRFVLCGSPVTAALAVIRSKKCIVLAMHQSLAADLVDSGFPPSCIASLYTHSRITESISGLSIRRVSNWLPMNASEANSLLMAGVCSSKIRLFPIGYDASLFYDLGCGSPPRDIDVLLVGRYVGSQNKHYHSRKNYDLIIQVVESLIAAGYAVAVMGRDWEKPFAHLDSLPEIIDVPHSATAAIYRRSKLFLSLSLLEGGPISWLEAMACGCRTLSCPTGFPLDHINSSSGSYLLSPRPTKSQILASVAQILELCAQGSDDWHMQQRRQILEASSFHNLAQQLQAMTC